MISVRLLCVLCVLFLSNLFANPGYQMSLSNIEKVSPDTYEFDVFIKSKGSDFELTSYQCAFSLNPLIINGGTVQFNYIEGSSDLRSEEHTSELQSRENLVCRLLLDHKNLCFL